MEDGQKDRRNDGSTDSRMVKHMYRWKDRETNNKEIDKWTDVGTDR